jgi:Mor family transcriptional regulator
MKDRRRKRIPLDQRRKRNKRIWMDYQDGIPVADLVAKNRVSQTQIYNILNEVRAFPHTYDIE